MIDPAENIASAFPTSPETTLAALGQPSPAAGGHQAPREAPGRGAGAREWTGLALLALPTILLGLDLTLLHLALPALALDLRPTIAQALWIVDA